MDPHPKQILTVGATKYVGGGQGYETLDLVSIGAPIKDSGWS